MSAQLEKMHAYLGSLRPQVSKQLTIITPEERGTPNLLHISPRKGIKAFIPQISRRSAMSEDNTVPRVHVAGTLLGCIIAHAAVVYDFNTKDVGGKEDAKYLGGYYIYAFQDYVSLKPSGRLVYDQVATGEEWLVPFEEPGQVYVGEPAGVFFLSEVVGRPMKGPSDPRVTAVIYLEVKKTLAWTKKKVLEPGYYCITGPIENRHLTYTADGHDVQSISKSDFQSVKTREVALLSRSDSVISRWSKKAT